MSSRFAFSDVIRGLVYLLVIVLPLTFWEPFPDPFFQLKWFVTFLVVAVIGVLLPFAPWHKPNLSRVECLGILLILSCGILNSLTRGQIESQVLLTYFACSILLFASMTCDLRADLFKLNFETVLIFSGAIFLCSRVVPLANALVFGIRRDADLAGAFGNINMSAEFIGMVVLTCVVQINEKKWRGWLSRLTLVFALAYSIIAMSRSIYVSLFAIISLIFYLHRESRKLIAVWVGSALLLTLPFWFFYLSNPTQHIGEDKAISIAMRLDAWQAGLMMIKERPMGWGSGAFEFGQLEFIRPNSPAAREDFILKDPHNEYIRWAIELGCIGFIAGLATVTSLFSKGIREESKRGPSITLFMSLFFLLQSAVQFPFQNSLPCLVAAVLIGRSMREPNAIWPSDWNSKFFRAFVFLFVGVFGFILFRFGSGKLAEVRAAEEPHFILHACEMDPYNWRSCLNASEFEARRGNLVQAQKIVTTLLENDPFHYPALRSLGVTLGMAQDPKGACESFYLYDRILSQRSSLHNYVEENCHPDWLRDLAKSKIAIYSKFLTRNN